MKSGRLKPEVRAHVAVLRGDPSHLFDELARAEQSRVEFYYAFDEEGRRVAAQTLAAQHHAVREQLLAGGAVDPIALLAQYERIVTRGRLGGVDPKNLRVMLRNLVMRPDTFYRLPNYASQRQALERTLTTIGVLGLHGDVAIVMQGDPNMPTMPDEFAAILVTAPQPAELFVENS